MKNNHIFLAVTLATVGVSCSNIERSRDLANPAVSGRVLAVQVCSICHGADGNSISPAFPRLAGQPAAYITNQLRNFRSHQRSDPAAAAYMWGLCRHLIDEQIGGLAEYYSKQTPRRIAMPAADPQLLAAGKEIFEKGIPAQNVIACMSCHGPKAQGTGAFPRLGYQHADYIVKQLNVFQNTQGRPGTPMELIAKALTVKNKEAVATFLQALPD